jgi:hypothetical protein
MLAERQGLSAVAGVVVVVGRDAGGESGLAGAPDEGLEVL